MKLWKTILLALLSIIIFSCGTPKENLQKRPIGLINNVSYTDSSFDNPNAANGFLVQYENNIYGITAKHVLLISKTDQMKFVDFEGSLKQWKMHPKNDTTEYVVMDKLLNPNRKDTLTWDYLFDHWETYDDWLVFSIKKNKTKNKPLIFRNKPLEKGDNLYVVGWSYTDSLGAQRVYEYTYDHTEGNYHNLIQTKGPKSLGGLSGAPIVDENGQLVGLVTSGGEDEKTKEVILQATSTKNMLQFISELN